MAFKQKRQCDTSISCSSNELVQSICNLSSIKSLRVTIESTVKSGLVLGAATVVGGLLFGPRGAAAGGILGSLGTTYMMDKEYKSVVDILMNETTQAQRDAFFEKIKALCTSENIMSLGSLLNQVQQGDFKLLNELKDEILEFLRQYFSAGGYYS